MLFTDFWFVVLVLVTMALFYTPVLRRWQTAILVLSSFVFYSLNQFIYLPLLLVSIAMNALVSHAVFFRRDRKQARFWLIVGLVSNLAILCFFKYMGLLGRSLPGHWTAAGEPAHWMLMIALPVGISFFTFEGISLVVDSYKARNEPTFFGTESTDKGKHLLKTTLFVSFFPHLVAGPILKAHDFYPQIKEKFFNWIDWNFCFRKLTIGYFLKMVVANNLEQQTFWLKYPYFLNRASGELLLLLFGYSMQIFADFAGYSLIAIGVAGLFGYRLPENFEFPYIARSFGEFWRRWHISLSSWLKEYLYFPLGGNRRGKVRTYVNLFIVMFLGGLWHGAAWSYALWGMTHGAALAIERFIKDRTGGDKRDPALDPWYVQAGQILFVFFVVTAAWLLFKLPDFSHVIEYVKATAVNWDKPVSAGRVFNILLFSLPVVVYHVAYLVLESRQRATTRAVEAPIQPALPAATAWLRPVAYGLMLFLIAVNSGTGGEFIYFQF
ncbi:MAG: MBOAT family O-acyltransferase [Tepidisphaeraceae bacterium]